MTEKITKNKKALKADSDSPGSAVKLSDIASKAVYVLLAGCFIWVIVKGFVSSTYRYKPLFLGIVTVLALALTVLMWLLFKKHEAFFKKNSRYFTIGFLVFMGGCQLFFAHFLRFSTIFDLDAIYGGAVQWVEEGTFPKYYEYFGMFHNNFGGLILLRGVFGIVKLFGFKDYFTAACIFNTILSVLMMFTTGSVCEKLIGTRAKMAAYFMFFISLPFYFISPTFYTDSLTMIFPVLILRLAIAAGERRKLAEKIACYILIGIISGIGCSIKATVVIMLIAVFIQTLLYADLRSWLPLAVCSAAMVFAVMFFSKALIYTHITRDYAEQKKVPIAHWIMMSMTGAGTYNPEDYDFTTSFDDPDERSAAVWNRLGDRVRKMGFKGLMAQFNSKIDYDFCDGTLGLADFLASPHGENNFLHTFLLKDGERYPTYKHICTGVLMAFYVLLVASCVFDIFGKGSTVRLLAPRLALLGLFMFFLLWEARWRYFSNYIPIIIISAVIGAEHIAARFRGFEGKRDPACGQRRQTAK